MVRDGGRGVKTIWIGCPHVVCSWVRELGHYLGIRKLKRWDAEPFTAPDFHSLNHRIFY